MKVWRKGSWINLREKISATPLSYDERCLLMLFKIEAGGIVPMHAHPQSQYGLVISGRGVFATKDAKIEVSEGDSYCIPANEEHGFEAIEEVLILDIFVPPRMDYVSLTRKPDHEV